MDARVLCGDLEVTGTGTHPEKEGGEQRFRDRQEEGEDEAVEEVVGGVLKFTNIHATLGVRSCKPRLTHPSKPPVGWTEIIASVKDDGMEGELELDTVVKTLVEAMYETNGGDGGGGNKGDKGEEYDVRYIISYFSLSLALSIPGSVDVEVHGATVDLEFDGGGTFDFKVTAEGGGITDEHNRLGISVSKGEKGGWNCAACDNGEDTEGFVKVGNTARKHAISYSLVLNGSSGLYVHDIEVGVVGGFVSAGGWEVEREGWERECRGRIPKPQVSADSAELKQRTVIARSDRALYCLSTHVLTLVLPLHPSSPRSS